MTLSSPATPNTILSSLPAQELSSFHSHLSRVDVKRGDVLLERGRPIEYVYFPETAVVSLRSGGGEGGKAPATGMIGREGLIGLSVYLGSAMPFERAVVLSTGVVQRMPAAAFAGAVASSSVAPRLVRRFAQAKLESIGLASVCIGRHSVEQRCAREILLLTDRMPSNEIEITHLALSELLGVRRPSVTLVADALRRIGAIEYGRRRIRVVDRGKLEAASCSCYAMLRGIQERFLADAVRLQTHPPGSATVAFELPEATSDAASDRVGENVRQAKERAARRSAATWPVSESEYRALMEDMGTVIGQLEVAHGELQAQGEAMDRMRSAREPWLLSTRVVLDGLPEAFLETDSDGCITELNAEAVSLFGQSRQTALGDSIARLVDLGDRGALRQLLAGNAAVPRRWENGALQPPRTRRAELPVPCNAAVVRENAAATLPGRFRWLVRPTA